ncbi:MAG: hypothetical protein LBG27_08570 [Spirochaetaceae bacterium]|nr:hypothetical protein [Spirochaetaceae bacterium]
MRQADVFGEPCGRASRLVVNLDLFGTRPGFAFELLGGHEEIEEGNQALAGGGKKSLFLKPFGPVAPCVFAYNGSVFLFNEAVAVFLAVS